MIKSKAEKYAYLLKQVRSLWDTRIGFEGNLCNVLSAIQHQMQFWWIGFYKVDPLFESEQEVLSLYVFTGPVACTLIPKGKGVCGAVWEKEAPILVPDVHAFPGHIACSSESKSELVIPVFKQGDPQSFWGVLDVDSEHLNHFDSEDIKGLSAIVELISSYL